MSRNNDKRRARRRLRRGAGIPQLGPYVWLLEVSADDSQPGRTPYLCFDSEEGRFLYAFASADSADRFQASLPRHWCLRACRLPLVQYLLLALHALRDGMAGTILDPCVDADGSLRGGEVQRRDDYEWGVHQMHWLAHATGEPQLGEAAAWLRGRLESATH